MSIRPWYVRLDRSSARSLYPWAGHPRQPTVCSIVASMGRSRSHIWASLSHMGHALAPTRSRKTCATKKRRRYVLCYPGFAVRQEIIGAAPVPPDRRCGTPPRCSFSSTDLQRQWIRVTSDALPCLWATAQIQQLTTNGRVSGLACFLYCWDVACFISELSILCIYWSEPSRKMGKQQTTVAGHTKGCSADWS
jgi:hypothetical protein